MCHFIKDRNIELVKSGKVVRSAWSTYYDVFQNFKIIQKISYFRKWRDAKKEKNTCGKSFAYCLFAQFSAVLLCLAFLKTCKVGS